MVVETLASESTAEWSTNREQLFLCIPENENLLICYSE